MVFIVVLLFFISLLFIIKQKSISKKYSFEPKDCHNGSIDLILQPINDDKKIIALKELRMLLNLDLKMCKYIIDNAPIVILKNISEEQEQILQEKFNYIGVNITFSNKTSNN